MLRMYSADKEENAFYHDLSSHFFGAFSLMELANKFLGRSRLMIQLREIFLHQIETAMLLRHF